MPLSRWSARFSRPAEQPSSSKHSFEIQKSVSDTEHCPSQAQTSEDRFSPPQKDRQELIRTIQEVQNHFKELHISNYSFDNEFPDYHLQKAAIPIMIKAIDQRHGGTTIKVRNFETLSKSIKNRPLSDGHISLGMNDSAIHKVIANIRTFDKDHASIIIVDSMYPSSGYENGIKTAMAYLQEHQIKNTHILVISGDLQRDTTSCPMFALATLTKLKTIARPWIDNLHQRHIESMKSMKDLFLDRSILSNSYVNVLDMRDSMPECLVRQIQSLKALKPRIDVDDYEYLAHKVKSQMCHRETLSFDYVNDRYVIHTLNFSTSIEKKRIRYLSHAIQYLKIADNAEISELHKSVKKTYKKVNPKLIIGRNGSSVDHPELQFDQRGFWPAGSKTTDSIFPYRFATEGKLVKGNEIEWGNSKVQQT